MIRKTAAITAASIAGVIIAGGAAVGANIGILSAADNNDLGGLSAQAPIVSPTTEQLVIIEPIAELASSTDSSQTFTVDLAGEVEIDLAETGLRLGDARANQGWSWQESATVDGTIVVTFSSNGDQLVFTATGNDDGTISASVDRPVSASIGAPVPPMSAPSSSYDDDHDEDNYYDEDRDDEDHDDEDHDDEDHGDEHDDDEHEGRDDDD